MTSEIRVFDPEGYRQRLRDLAEAFLLARQRVQIEILARNNAVEDLAHHLQVPAGEERLAVVDDVAFFVARAVNGETVCRASLVHATTEAR